VSAGSASPAAQESGLDSVRALQHTLYRAAKADPGRRFHSLRDKVYRRDVLQRAWEDVRRNGGAAGIDWITIADVEQYGVSRLLDEVGVALKEDRWRPLPARRVFIPKPGSAEQRPLSIPPVVDRVVQAARAVTASVHLVVPASPVRVTGADSGSRLTGSRMHQRRPRDAIAHPYRAVRRRRVGHVHR
jgi:hypothetical protein